LQTPKGIQDTSSGHRQDYLIDRARQFNPTALASYKTTLMVHRRRNNDNTCPWGPTSQVHNPRLSRPRRRNCKAHTCDLSSKVPFSRLQKTTNNPPSTCKATDGKTPSSCKSYSTPRGMERDWMPCASPWAVEMHPIQSNPIQSIHPSIQSNPIPVTADKTTKRHPGSVIGME
jgi:hypothetical protein